MDDNIRFHRVRPERREPDGADVPVELRRLLPYADRLRHFDWAAPERVLTQLDATEVDEFKRLMAEHRPALEAWLEESERNGSPYPAAHVPFSSLRMIADALSL